MSGNTSDRTQSIISPEHPHNERALTFKYSLTKVPVHILYSSYLSVTVPNGLSCVQWVLPYEGLVYMTDFRMAGNQKYVVFFFQVEGEKWLILRILRKCHCFHESFTENDNTPKSLAVKKKEYIIKKYSPIIEIVSNGGTRRHMLGAEHFFHANC